MAKLLLIAVDLDDTAVGTYDYIYPEIKRFFRKKGMTEELAYVEKMHAAGKTSMMYRKDVSDIVFEEIIKPGHFMRDAEPSLLIQQGFFEAIEALKAHYSYLIKNVICTHRGFKKDGLQLSREWLIKNEGLDLFDEIHSIKSKDHRNKVEFLKSTYPEYEILLLDDNPLGDIETVHPPMKELLVYDQINKFDGYVNQRKFTNIDDFIQQCISIIRS